ncbi:EpsG family protein [Weissella muntiaci]|uniref:EpsG family protein n=1 Tax=Weissella muntiaci TaxID=2508881 RepID=A0A6C2CC57_9LACO|nr:EpsG family protein [Weissella muntiaci]TYC50695.1 EpsG family protein [Weissella muntiaci]
MIYWYMVLLIVIFGLTSTIFPFLKKSLFVGSFFILWLVSALRYDVGVDFMSYKYYFDFSNNLVLPFEKGFIGLIFFVRSVATNSQYLFIVVSLITIFFIFKAISDQSTGPFLSIFMFLTLYMYFSSFNILRQYISVALIFYAVKFIKVKQFTAYYFVVLLAISIHSSALIFLLLPLVVRRIIRRSTLVLIMILEFIFFLYSTYWISLIAIIIPKMAIYTGTQSVVHGTANMLALIVGSALIVYFLNKDQLDQLNPNNNIYGLLMTMLFPMLFFFDNIVVQRLGVYFIIFLIVFVPSELELLKQGRYRILQLPFYMLCLILGIYSFNNQLALDNSGVLPYQVNTNLNLNDSYPLPEMIE